MQLCIDRLCTCLFKQHSCELTVTHISKPYYKSFFIFYLLLKYECCKYVKFSELSIAKPKSDSYCLILTFIECSSWMRSVMFENTSVKTSRLMKLMIKIDDKMMFKTCYLVVDVYNLSVRTLHAFQSKFQHLKLLNMDSS